MDTAAAVGVAGLPVAEVAARRAPAGETRPWSAAARVGFRVAFCYVGLYLLPFPLDLIPGLGKVAEGWSALWNALVPWVGRRVFGLDIVVLPNGSGDTTYNYVQVLCVAGAALLAAAIWTGLDRRRTQYAVLQRWLRGYVRLFLGLTMVSYGAFKVIQAQFPPPTLDRLLQPFGDASPMGLLWTFMGASLAYNVFTGIGEMAGGLLLASRRTTLLGALVCLGVLANVVMLNFSYDVPVKLFSTHLLAMAAFLAAPDAGRLLRFFVLNQPVEPAELPPLFARPLPHRVALGLRGAAFAGFTVLFLVQSHEQRSQWGRSAGQGPFAGLWEVVEHSVDGRPLSARPGDEERWRRLVFSASGLLAIQTMDDARERYRVEVAAADRRMTLRRRDDPAWTATFEYRRTADRELALSGLWDGHRVEARLSRTEAPRFRLTTRGFHWINEFPYNR